MGRGEFYREWARRAFSGKIARAELASGLGAIAVAALGWAAKRYPAMSDWVPFTVDQATVTVFVAVFIFTVVLGFILAPYDMHLESIEDSEGTKSRLDELQSAIAPSLIFTSLRSDRFPGHPTEKVYRIGIRNTSDARALHNVELMISSEAADGSTATAERLVKDTHGNSAWDINPGGTKYVDLLAVRPDKTPPRVYFAPYLPGYSERSAHPGVYSVHLEATCRETRKTTRRFTLTILGDGGLNWKEAPP